MKILLREDVPNVGLKGDIKVVKDGYARNFLIPRGLALQANKGIETQAASMRKSREQREQRERAESLELAAKLEGGKVTLNARVGGEGKMFGSITPAEIINAVDSQLSIAIDRHDLRIDDPIKSLGTHSVVVNLKHEVTATITLEVVAAS